MTGETAISGKKFLTVVAAHAIVVKPLLSA